MDATTPGSMLERVVGLTPLIQAHRAEAEAAIRMAPAVHEALAAAGVYRAYAPLEVGGSELELPDQVRVIEQLGYADVTAAWCTLNSWGSGALAVRMNEQARDELYARPDAFFGFGLSPSGRARRVDGGFELSGRWPVVSGGTVASWFALASIVMDGDRPATVAGLPDVRFLLVDASEVEVLDTWNDVNGMRGTGSHAVRVESVRVPEYLAVRMADPSRVDRPAFRFSLVVSGLACSAAAILGAARSGLDALVVEATGRVSEALGEAWRDWPTTQDQVASSKAALDAARAGIVEAAALLQDSVRDASAPPPELRADLYAMVDHAHRTARTVTSDLFAVASISGARLGHGVERALRDTHTMSVNWTRYRQMHFDAGRVQLGLDPTHRFF